jgi:hypothetical protein
MNLRFKGCDLDFVFRATQFSERTRTAKHPVGRTAFLKICEADFEKRLSALLRRGARKTQLKVVAWKSLFRDFRKCALFFFCPFAKIERRT